MLKECKCFKCEKLFSGDELYSTDCFDGFGPASYCAACIIKGAKAGFDDPHVICSCGAKMTIWCVDKMILQIVDKDGILYYFCNECDPDCSKGIGLYVHQRDEVIDRVFEGGVHPDELEHEYVYDFEYSLHYHIDNPYLYQNAYNPDWRQLMEDMGIEVN